VRTDFPSKEQAIRYFSRHEALGQNGEMLREDIGLSILPIRGRSDSLPNFKVYFDGDERQKKFANSLCKDIAWGSLHYDDYDEQGIICEAIESVVGSMAVNGWSVYEILYDKESESVRLSEFSTQNLYKIFRKYLQITRNDKDKNPIRFNVLSSNNVWSIEIPKLLGRKRGFQRMMSKIDAYGFVPDFYMQDIQEQKIASYFNLKKYSKENEIYVGRVTKQWGWDGRGMDRNYTTDFFMFYRKLTFKWAQLVLLNHIIDELNKLFVRLEIRAKIVIEGILSPEEVLEGREKLVSGEKDFKDMKQYLD
jgi:hypothetical protein